MAFGRLERTTGPQPMGEINMTPLIDVVLVLLVIFMVTAPLMTSSLKLDLPQAEGAQAATDNAPFLALAIDAEGKLYLNEELLDPESFGQRLAEKAQANPLLEVQLRADKNVPYGQVAGLIGQVQQAGLSRIAFVADPEGAAPAAKGR